MFFLLLSSEYISDLKIAITAISKQKNRLSLPLATQPGSRLQVTRSVSGREYERRWGGGKSGNGLAGFFEGDVEVTGGHSLDQC